MTFFGDRKNQISTFCISTGGFSSFRLPFCEEHQNNFSAFFSTVVYE
jgi:hypothetical protein